jgi:UDP-N-acetylmuramoyl-tripeptide--D-alanyl-D-alanine ligase
MSTAIPENRVELTLAEVAEATGGQVLAGAERRVRGVVTDTRADVAHKLFIALSGERFDGHNFAGEAGEQGAAAILVERDVAATGTVGVVRVRSTLDALGALARFHRRRWGGQVVAVAGSAGKTTTRNAISFALETVAPGAVHSAAGNLNNQIGVPMVLLGAEERHRITVIEIGTNHLGEVESLARTAEPDMGVLTLIALEHGEGLGTLDDIEIEEGALLATLGAASTAIANGDDLRCRRRLARSPAGAHFTFGADPSCHYRLLSRHPREIAGAVLEVERPRSLRKSAPEDAWGRETIEIETPLLGHAGALSTIAALCVADRLAPQPLDPEHFSSALARGTAESGRLTARALADGSVLIDDSYNANPASVESSLIAAAEIAKARGSRLIVVLGEMRELGPTSSAEHAAVGEVIARSGAAVLVAVSGEAARFVPAARAAGIEATFANDAQAAIEVLRSLRRRGDVVLVKASRGVGLERVASALESGS